MTLWEALRAQPTLLYDGSWLARMLWDVRHPPKWVDWIPPWRRHKKPCEERFRALIIKPGSGKFPPSYCSTCDYWHLTRRHPVFWLVLIFGER